MFPCEQDTGGPGGGGEVCDHSQDCLYPDTTVCIPACMQYQVCARTNLDRGNSVGGDHGQAVHHAAGDGLQSAGGWSK